jgi:hypothetical protein
VKLSGPFQKEFKSLKGVNFVTMNIKTITMNLMLLLLIAPAGSYLDGQDSTTFRAAVPACKLSRLREGCLMTIPRSEIKGISLTGVSVLHQLHTRLFLVLITILCRGLRGIF